MIQPRIRTGLTLAAALSPLAAAPAQIAPFNGEVVDTGTTAPLHPTQTVVGHVHLFDADQDGHLDAFVSSYDGLVRLDGTAEGRFVDPELLTVVPFGPRFTEVDVDDDGIDDLLAYGSGGFWAFRPDGAGGLKPHIQVALGPTADEVTVADLDGDGDPDVAGADFSNGGLTVWFQGVDNTYTPGPTVPTADARSIAHGDMDADGDIDLLLTVWELHAGGYNLGTWLNDGSGAFTQSANVLLGVDDPMHVVDLDEDGHLDVVTVDNGFPGGFRVVHGDGSGQLAAPVVISAGDDVDSMLVIDADGDGQLDLVGTQERDDAVYGRGQNVIVLRGLGGGAFDAPLARSLGPAPVHVAAADLDGQGSHDLVVSIPRLAGLAVLHGERDGGFFAGRIEHDLGNWTAPQDVVMADLDLDGDQDLVTLVDAGLISLLSDGGTGLTALPAHPAGFEPRDVELGDLDGDGVPDAVVAAPIPVKAIVRLGDGAGGWTNTNSVNLPESAFDTDLADMNGDGRLDIVAGSSPPAVAPGVGNGLFGLQQLAPSGAGGFVLTGDLDMDGHLDLVSVTHVLHVFQGDGTGALTKPDEYDLGLISDLAVGFPALEDLDRDGDLDLFIGTNLTDEIVPLLNDGDGAFVPGGAIEADNLGRLATGDVDGDGLADLVFHSSGDGVIHWARGGGDGSFDDARRFLTQGSPVALELADFDGDLRQDVLLSTYYLPDTVAVLRHEGEAPSWATTLGSVPGSAAPPALSGSGALLPGTSAEMRLTGGPAAALSTLVVGFTELSLPFKGGLLVPTPDLLLNVPLDAGGGFALQTTWPAGVPADTALFWQAWMPDGGAPFGLAASNGLRTLTP